MSLQVPWLRTRNQQLLRRIPLPLFLVLLGATTVAFAETLVPPDPSVSVGRTIPFEGFVDENGRDFSSLVGEPRATSSARPWIVSPIYTACPHTCSAITAGLRRALEQSELQTSDYRILSFSFDPQETPEALQAFRSRMKLPPEWLTLRADASGPLERTLRSLDFRTITVGDGVFEHPNLVAILAPDMTLVDYAFGVEFSAAELTDKVQRARAGVSRLERWRTTLFFFAALGFVGGAWAFVWLLHKRRMVAARSSHVGSQ